MSQIYKLAAPSSSSVVTRHRTLYAILLSAVVLLMILPIWSVSVIPWQDYGYHLGRVYILAHYSEVATFQQHYEVKYEPLPNLAIDLIATPLVSWVNPYTVGKLFASLLILLFALGAHLLARSVHPGASWLVVPATFLLYNSLLFGGFVNYEFSVAMMLVAGAVWLQFDTKPSFGRGLLATVLAFATYLSHISGFACLCVLIGICTFYRVVRARRIQLRDACALLPLVPGFIAYMSLRASENTVGMIQWAPLFDKVKFLWTPFNSYSTWVDVLVLVSLILAAALVWRYGTIQYDPRLLSVAAAFAIAFVIFPFEIRTGNQADVRFLVPALVVAACALTVEMPRRWARVAYITALIVFSLRIADTARHWLRADAISREQHALLDQIPENSSIYPLVLLPDDRSARKIRWQLVHLADYMTIDRHAFSGSMLAHVGQQPIRRRIESPYANYGTSKTAVGSFPWPAIFASYEYIWTYDPPAAFMSFLNQHGDLVGRAGLGFLFKVRRSTTIAQH